jgi:hypothetical protein
MVRSVAVLAPSGLGVVDLGYATVLRALGGEPGAVAAFVLLRRAKEAVWVAAGYAILAAERKLRPHHLIGPYLEPAEDVGAERGADGHIGRVPSSCNEYTTDARGIVSRIEGVPGAV